MADKHATLIQRLVLWSGYAAFFVFCFMLFAYWTFPYDRVRALIISRAEASSPGSTVEIGELSPYWLTGITLTDVTLESAANKGEEPIVLKLDEVTVSVAPIAMAMGTTRVDFSAEVDEGGLDGTFSTEEEGPSRLQLELDAVELGSLGLAAYAKVPMKGSATGEIDVTLAPDAADTEGMIELAVEGFTLGDGKTKVPLPGGWGGVTVPPIGVGTLAVQIPVKEGVATIEKLDARGKDVSLSGSGSVRLVQPFKSSRADITLGVKVDPGFAKREAKIGTILGMPGVKSARGSDGMIRFTLAGPISNLKARPGAASGARGKRPPRRRPAKARN